MSQPATCPHCGRVHPSDDASCTGVQDASDQVATRTCEDRVAEATPQPDYRPVVKPSKPRVISAVDIAIIGVGLFIFLFFVAVQYLGNERAAVAQARTEITDLSNAIANAKTSLNNVPYLPSRLVLREDNAYQANPDEQRTVQFLRAAFGRNVTRYPQDWNGDGKIDAGAVFTLQGPTALVFLLGGIPTSAGGVPGCTGFSTNKNNPAAPGGTRLGPFYQNFRSARLRPDTSGLAPGFLYYTDSYGKGQPYLYFSSYAAGNDYNTIANHGSSDAPIGMSVQPYQDTNGLFINGTGFQILCAGKNGLFGPGGVWNATTGYGPGQPGSDDQASFSGSTLGLPQS